MLSAVVGVLLLALTTHGTPGSIRKMVLSLQAYMDPRVRRGAKELLVLLAQVVVQD